MDFSRSRTITAQLILLGVKLYIYLGFFLWNLVIAIWAKFVFLTLTLSMKCYIILGYISMEINVCNHQRVWGGEGYPPVLSTNLAIPSDIGHCGSSNNLFQSHFWSPLTFLQTCYFCWLTLIKRDIYDGLGFIRNGSSKMKSYFKPTCFILQTQGLVLTYLLYIGHF